MKSVVPISPADVAGRTLGAVVSGEATTFRVWAPQRTSVDLAICEPPTDSGVWTADACVIREFRPLQPDSSGYWSGVTRDLEPGTLYKFRLDGHDGLEAYVQVPLDRAPQLRTGLPLQLLDADGKVLATNPISFVSPRVDDQTQTVLAKSLLKQKPDSVRVLQFVRSRLVWRSVPGLKWMCPVSMWYALVPWLTPVCVTERRMA